jgi:hypothetical protein
MRSTSVTDSSNISEVSWHESNHNLVVTFANGQMYLYEDVAPELYGQLVSAPSVGKFFADKIRNKYICTAI